jgi:hypothetical protein
MATFAMICNNRVIEVLYDLEVAPSWPPDQLGNPVTSVECSAEATRDWLYNPETGEVFELVPPEPIEPSEPEAPTSEYEQYYNEVNAALTGGM